MEVRVQSIEPRLIVFRLSAFVLKQMDRQHHFVKAAGLREAANDLRHEPAVRSEREAEREEHAEHHGHRARDVRIDAGGGGSSCTIFARIVSCDCPSNGRRPVVIS